VKEESVVLTARERTRYARHLLLPEIGLAGQERLLATHVQLAASAHPRASQVARLYLERAGVAVEGEAPPEAREQREVAPEDQRAWVADPAAVERLAGSAALVPAAAALAGALGAVEAIKEVLQLGTKGDLTLAGIVMGPEDV
jgi:hypothetical protein